MDWIIVGLGNPGAQYAKTRHNIGWMVAEAFAQSHNAAFRQGEGKWYEARCTAFDHNVLVMLPTTYMNLSGKAVRQAQTTFKTPTENIIAIVDEYNFPIGRIHVKNSGSDGGHNGTASLIEELGSEAFIRVRCGIGKNFGPGELVRYVLQPFAPEELAACAAMIADATNALERILQEGIARAMQEINARKQ